CAISFPIPADGWTSERLGFRDLSPGRLDRGAGCGSMRSLARFVARRLALLLLTLFAVSVLIFAITQLLPGDVATMILGMSATDQDLATLRHQLGLEQPAVVQYLHWFTGLLQGDPGMSLRFQRPVAEVLRQPLENSAILGVAGT